MATLVAPASSVRVVDTMATRLSWKRRAVMTDQPKPEASEVIGFERDGEERFVCLTQRDQSGAWTNPVFATVFDLRCANFVPVSSLAAAEARIEEESGRAQEWMETADQRLRKLAEWQGNEAQRVRELRDAQEARDGSQAALVVALREKRELAAMHGDLMRDNNELSLKVTELADERASERAASEHLERRVSALIVELTRWAERRKEVAESDASRAAYITVVHKLGLAELAFKNDHLAAPEPVRDGPFCAMCPSEKRAPFPCSVHPQAGPGYIDRAAPAPPSEPPRIGIHDQCDQHGSELLDEGPSEGPTSPGELEYELGELRDVLRMALDDFWEESTDWVSRASELVGDPRFSRVKRAELAVELLTKQLQDLRSQPTPTGEAVDSASGFSESSLLTEHDQETRPGGEGDAATAPASSSAGKATRGEAGRVPGADGGGGAASAGDGRGYTERGRGDAGAAQSVASPVAPAAEEERHCDCGHGRGAHSDTYPHVCLMAHCKCVFFSVLNQPSPLDGKPIGAKRYGGSTTPLDEPPPASPPACGALHRDELLACSQALGHRGLHTALVGAVEVFWGTNPASPPASDADGEPVYTREELGLDRPARVIPELAELLRKHPPQSPPQAVGVLTRAAAVSALERLASLIGEGCDLEPALRIVADELAKGAKL
jgi:hypothetical protein